MTDAEKIAEENEHWAEKARREYEMGQKQKFLDLAAIAIIGGLMAAPELLRGSNKELARNVFEMAQDLWDEREKRRKGGA